MMHSDPIPPEHSLCRPLVRTARRPANHAVLYHYFFYLTVMARRDSFRVLCMSVHIAFPSGGLWCVGA